MKNGTACRGTVVLYMPSLVPPESCSAETLAIPPMSALAVAGPLRDAGFDVRLIDGKWEPRARAEIAEIASRAVALGISCLTGYAVKDGLEMAEVARAANPALPILWGGWHPSSCARQAATDPRVDIVVRNQGERAVVEVLDALEAKRSLRSVAGVTYREGDEIVHTPDRPSEDINQFPPPAYEFVDPRRYIRTGRGLRHASAIFSRGCPYRCDFCLDSRQQWLGLRVDRIESELDFWLNGHGVNSLRFFDGNFFLGRDWISAICQRILDRGWEGKFRWSATGVANRIVRMDGGLLDLVRRAGCRQVALGAETGSEELLAQVTNKTTVEHTVEAVRLLTRNGINQFVFFMVGFPVEPEGALEATLRLIARLKSINPDLDYQLSYCIPLPGSQMFRIAVEKGLLAEPKGFADWAHSVATRPNLGHIGPAYVRKVRRTQTYLDLAYPPLHSTLRRVAEGPLGALMRPVRRAAAHRLDRLSFAFPVEAWLLESLRRLRDPTVRVAAGVGIAPARSAS